MRRKIFDDVHRQFRESVRTFLRREAVPHEQRWERAGIIDRDFWQKAGTAGFVGFEAPERWGGLGITDFRFNAILDEEIEYQAVVTDNFALENDIVCPYLLDLTDDAQKARWLPAFTAGELVASLAMSEPGAGSDLQAIATTGRRDGDSWVLNGSKTFVTSGIQADLVIVAARTAPGSARGAFSLFCVEAGTDGFRARAQAREDRPPRAGHG